MSTAAAKIAPFLLTGEKTGGIPGIIIILIIAVIIYYLIKSKKK